MWLPKDERKLLSFYWRRINKVETRQRFEMGDLINTLGKRELSAQSKTNREIILYSYDTLESVNNLLSQRDLIKWENLDPESISAARFYDHPTLQELFENTKVDLCITLTIKGYDLGRKYSSWWDCSGLWFSEYRNHWMWVIVSFLGGVLGALLVNWLSR